MWRRHHFPPGQGHTACHCDSRLPALLRPTDPQHPWSQATGPADCSTGSLLTAGHLWVKSTLVGVRCGSSWNPPSTLNSSAVRVFSPSPSRWRGYACTAKGHSTQAPVLAARLSAAAHPGSAGPRCCLCTLRPVPPLLAPLSPLTSERRGKKAEGTEEAFPDSVPTRKKWI